jgi:hypothetical protein
MGADIHLVIEASTTPGFSNPNGMAFFEWPRNSQLFRAMGLHGKSCLIPARGFPEPASSMAYWQFGLCVIPDDDLESALAMPSITETEALRALQDGQSQLLSYRKDFVSNPAYSNASWLSLSEFFEALRFASIDPSSLSLECLLTVKLLESIEAYGQHARMVFWFDL